MIWRRILVASSVTLRDLHGIIQVAMGWEGIHLFQFDIHAVDYGSWELHGASPDIALHNFSFRWNDRFSYIYDMSDYWKHDIRVEAFPDKSPKKTYPICTVGSGEKIINRFAEADRLEASGLNPIGGKSKPFGTYDSPLPCIGYARTSQSLDEAVCKLGHIGEIDGNIEAIAGRK